MAYLKYYDDEKVRWPVLHAAARIGDAEIELGIRRLARAFNLTLKGVRVRLTRGRRVSCAGKYSITINREYVSWLLIAHEVAHTYWYIKHSPTRRASRNAHGPAHAGITDRFCAWITDQGWHLGTLAHEVALAEAATAQQAQHRALVAATPPPVDMRIAQREAQVARLTRKIKALTTRRGKALRSLAALKRVQAKAPVKCPSLETCCELEWAACKYRLDGELCRARLANKEAV